MTITLASNIGLVRVIVEIFPAAENDRWKSLIAAGSTTSSREP